MPSFRAVWRSDMQSIGPLYCKMSPAESRTAVVGLFGVSRKNLALATTWLDVFGGGTECFSFEHGWADLVQIVDYH